MHVHKADVSMSAGIKICVSIILKLQEVSGFFSDLNYALV